MYAIVRAVLRCVTAHSRSLRRTGSRRIPDTAPCSWGKPSPPAPSSTRAGEIPSSRRSLRNPTGRSHRLRVPLSYRNRYPGRSPRSTASTHHCGNIRSTSRTDSPFGRLPESPSQSCGRPLQKRLPVRLSRPHASCI